MNHSMKNLSKFKRGTVVVGRWHHQSYTILRELGFGANGIVYLAQMNGKHVALKMSDNSLSITSEVNVLKSFAKVQGYALGPSLLDVDDWEIGGTKIPFYTMEYIHGPNFLEFIQRNESVWVGILISQLLSDLEVLHQQGWVFGDLKPENLIITGPPPKIRCIDVGGTTLQGRAIKEFTEFYDRGYWGLGSRKADPSYDLFAVAMIMINTAYPKRFSKTTGGIEELKAKIKQSHQLQPFSDLLIKALTGRYTTARQMRTELLVEINPNSKRSQKNSTTSKYQGKSSFKNQQQQPVKARQVNQGIQKNSSYSQQPQHAPQWSAKGRTIETVSIVLIISMLYFLYVYSHVN